MGILCTSNAIICGPSRVNNPIIRLLALYTGQEADIHLEGTVPPVSRFSAPPPLASPMTIDMIVFEGHRGVATASSTKSKYALPPNSVPKHGVLGSVTARSPPIYLCPWGFLQPQGCHYCKERQGFPLSLTDLFQLAQSAVFPRELFW